MLFSFALKRILFLKVLLISRFVMIRLEFVQSLSLLSHQYTRKISFNLRSFRETVHLANKFSHNWRSQTKCNTMSHFSTQRDSHSSPIEKDDEGEEFGLDEFGEEDGSDAASYDSKKVNHKGQLKVRQHVNPLSSKYQIPLDLKPDWLEQAFANPYGRSIVIDIGCSKGTWALKSAEENKEVNYLGLEIRKPVVEFALARKSKRNITNVHYLASNANVDLCNILKSLNANNVDVRMLCVQFPDPHFKNKHKKRRVVNDDLVSSIARLCRPGLLVFVQSDVRDVIDDMVENFGRNPIFEAVDGYSPINLNENASPVKVLTEREIATYNKGLPVYRMLYRLIAADSANDHP